MGDEIQVLYVDDCTTSLKMRDAFLSEYESITMVTESSPSAALELLASTDIDCILSDFEMPEQDGITFLNAVRMEYPLIPFILFSGQESKELAEAALDANATDFVPKSVCSISYRILVNRIENAVDHVRAQKQLQNQLHSNSK